MPKKMVNVVYVCLSVYMCGTVVAVVVVCSSAKRLSHTTIWFDIIPQAQAQASKAQSPSSCKMHWYKYMCIGICIALNTHKSYTY